MTLYALESPVGRAHSASAAHASVLPSTVASVGVAADVLEDLRSAASAVSPEQDALLHLRLSDAAARARSVSTHWDFAAPARTIERVLGFEGDNAAKTRVRRATVARLALHHFVRPSPLPDSVLALFPQHFARLSRFLNDGPRDRYIDDFFFKDVRYALGVTIPCGAMQLDLGYRIGPKLVVRDAVRNRSPRTALSYAGCRGWKHWGNDHIDLRAMKEFNPAGWTAAFRRMAEILELRPKLRGIAGVSWFYDPELARISPSLAYLHQIPLRHGAFLVRTETTEHDIHNATIRSRTRRELYEKGEYRPASYLLAWPRAELIAWAKPAPSVRRWSDRFRQAARLVMTAARNS